MAFKPYTLWIDIEGNRLVSGAGSDSAVSAPRFTQGDTALIDINFLKRIDGTLTQTPLDSGSTVKVGVGYREKVPTAGTFTLTYDGQTTSALAYNSTAAQVAAAINALSTVTAEGGVTVTQVGDGQIIKWVAGTSHTSFTGNGEDLFPSSTVKLVQIESGTSQAELLHLAQTPVAFSDAWTPISTSVATITNTVPYTSGVPKVYRLAVSAEPVSGYVILTYTDATHGFQGSVSIDITSTAGNLRTALQTLQYTNGDIINVSKVDDFVWDIFLRGNHIIDIASSFITSSMGVTGALSFNTAEVHSFLNGAESGDLVLEVMVETVDGEQTILQTDCSIFSDVIDSGAVVPVPFSSCLDEAVANNRFVRRDIDQTPTTGDLNTIWLNLGVLAWLGSDVAAALNAAGNPSGANPLATMADISGGGGGPYLNLSGGLMTGPISFDAVGGQNIAKGTFDNGAGGYNGISLTCAVGYELNWQGGRMTNWYGGAAQTLIFDSPLKIASAGGLTFSDNTVQYTAATVSEAPIDSQFYVRQNASWTVMPTFNGGNVGAPINVIGSGGQVTLSDSAGLDLSLSTAGALVRFADGTTQNTAATSLGINSADLYWLFVDHIDNYGSYIHIHHNASGGGSNFPQGFLLWFTEYLTGQPVGSAAAYLDSSNQAPYLCNYYGSYVELWFSSTYSGQIKYSNSRLYP